MKTENYINGKYFAEILKEVLSDLNESKYQNAEPRLSIYGKNPKEWALLSKWAVTNNIYSDNVRWIIQVPRLYDVFKNNKLVKNFSEVISNIFNPLFEATLRPSENEYLYKFLTYVTGFDSVDDESKQESSLIEKIGVPPEKWEDEENPPYLYYLYYMYSNMVVLNNLRRSALYIIAFYGM